jgi:hypothetical protein
MPAILIFQKDTTGLTVTEIAESLHGVMGIDCCLYAEGKKVGLDAPASAGEIGDSIVWVNLPDLEDDEGLPTVRLEVAPRLDREDPIQALVDELIEQDKTLAETLNHNARDITLTFDDTPAGEEAAYVLAYIIASETSSGILVPAFEEGDDTAWFDDPEDFADIVFGEEDEDIEDDIEDEAALDDDED